MDMICLVDCSILEDSYKDNGGFELAENVYGTAFSCLGINNYNIFIQEDTNLL